MRLLWALLLLAACSSRPVLELDERWRPLEEVREASFVTPGMLMTLGEKVYVRDLAAFGLEFPEGSVRREAILLHEQVHAVSQRSSRSLPEWLAWYLTDRTFRLVEEEAAYEVQITHLVRHSVPVNVDGFAELMAGEYRGMISYADARRWVEAVVRRAR